MASNTRMQNSCRQGTSRATGLTRWPQPWASRPREGRQERRLGSGGCRSGQMAGWGLGLLTRRPRACRPSASSHCDPAWPHRQDPPLGSARGPWRDSLTDASAPRSPVCPHCPLCLVTPQSHRKSLVCSFAHLVAPAFPVTAQEAHTAEVTEPPAPPCGPEPSAGSVTWAGRGSAETVAFCSNFKHNSAISSLTQKNHFCAFG